MEIAKPREETLEKFRKQFFKEKYGVGYTMDEEELKRKVEEQQEEGLVMDPDKCVGLITNPETGLAKRILDGFDEEHVEHGYYDPEYLEALVEEEKSLAIGKAVFDPVKILKMLKVLGAEVKIYPPTDFAPVLIVNMEGEAILLAPVYKGESSAPSATYEDLKNRQLDEARESAEALRNSDILRITEKDTRKAMNIHRSQVKGLVIYSWAGRERSGAPEVIIEGANGEIRIEVDEETFEMIREAVPDIPVEDKRSTYSVDWAKLTEKVQEAWKTRDFLMEDTEGYTKCLDYIADKIHYGGSLGCSLEFFVQHWGEEPPPFREPFRIRSLLTPLEWAQALINKIMDGIYKMDFKVSENLYGEEGGFIGKLELNFKVDSNELPSENIRVEPAEYKAKHLKNIKSVVEFGLISTTPWGTWETQQKMKNFESDEVKV